MLQPTSERARTSSHSATRNRPWCPLCQKLTEMTRCRQLGASVLAAAAAAATRASVSVVGAPAGAVLLAECWPDPGGGAGVSGRRAHSAW
jgi:hypothetical protein